MAEVGLFRDVLVLVAFTVGGDEFSATSRAGLIGSSSSRRMISTFTGGADGLSVLADTVAGGGRVIPGGVPAAAVGRDFDGASAGGDDVKVTDGLGAAATMVGRLVAGDNAGGGLEPKATSAGRFVSTGCADGCSSWSS